MKHLRLIVAFFLLNKMSPAECCSNSCQCPEAVPGCGAGTSLVLDGCGCCRVCAKQAGELCSQGDTCDPNQGLQCDLTADPQSGLGVCIAHEGNICMYDGVVYRNGETFQPSCKYQCSCKDGLIGCVPRCNLDVLLPGPDCPFPEQVQMAGECCEQWVCDHKEPTSTGGFAMAAYRQEATFGVDSFNPSLNCIEQTTEWSACSKTCGIGMSTRVTNKNRHCEMVKETRICVVRPCAYHKVIIRKGKKCVRTPKATNPTHFEYNECTSVQSYKPKYCGVCNDGRCCTPHTTKTLLVDFKCPGGKIIEKQMMVINTCACHYNCPQDNTVLQPGVFGA